jgi:hypothetical protein
VANRKANSRPSADFPWASYSERELLKLRLRDLGLRLDETELRDRILQLYSELDARGLSLFPNCWLSGEWFSPSTGPGIAIPFFLAHGRLKRLEFQQMNGVEGGTRSWCMQLLRHEAGHAYETAYRLSRRKKWRTIFGRASKPYPDYYIPEPFSRKYVLHLDWWYAQSHPVEDFAETFAVWLQPRSDWRRRYQDWPALKKLRYVDELMREIAGQAPPLKHVKPVEPLHELTETLREYYRKKQARYGSDHPGFYDRDLRRLFPAAPRRQRKLPPASAFLRRMGAELPRRVAFWTGEYAYTINLVLKDMIQRCRELDMRVSRPESAVRREAAIFLTMQTMKYLYSSKRRRLAV